MTDNHPVYSTPRPNSVCRVLASFGARIIHKTETEPDQAQPISSYRLERLLGRGGMGEVWLARHKMLGRPAAIKFVRPEALGNESKTKVLRRFEREAHATAALSSPHTINVYDFGTTEDNTFYYAMEFLDGLDLDSLVQRFGPVPAERTVHFLKQVCLSLAEAHHQGLVHRDIKPANIYACRIGLDYDFIKVLDFGLVKQPERPEQEVTRLTIEGITMGTPGYIAPEVAMGGRVDARTDLYSLGCVGYWLITGHQVFEGITPLQTVIDHVRTIPLPPSQRTELEIPEELEKILLWCLEKDPANRPASAQELARHLDSIAEEHPWTQDDSRRWWSLNLPASLGQLNRG